jgi:predicted nucleic acid-binding protein
VTTLLVDTSVLIKWFHSEGESQVAEARALREATRRGDVEARVIDLALYEMGNVLLHSLRWSGPDVADQLDDLVVICGSPLAMSPDWLRQAAVLGAANRLTFYDACWAAAARALGISLVSADVRLLDAGLAESPGAASGRLRLAPWRPATT